MHSHVALLRSRVFTVRSSIAGLLVLQHELEFLGLFDTEERASARQYLPARKVRDRRHGRTAKVFYGSFCRSRVSIAKRC